MAELVEIGLGNALAAALLAVPAAILSRLCRRPAVAHALWLLVLVKLLVPIGVRVPVPWLSDAPPTASAAVPEPDQAILSASTDASAAPPALTIEDLEADIRALRATLDRAEEPPEQPATNVDAAAGWSAFIGGVWLLGSLWWALWTGLTVQRFRRLLRHARLAPPAVLREVEALAAELGLRRIPGVYLVTGRISPMIWGLGRTPALLLPARLLRNLNPDQVRGLLLHELAHLRRGDQWVRLVELLAVGLYWWHPLLWWARRELHEAEEQCCDAWVVATRQGGERAYASALLETVAFLSRTPMPMPIAASGIGNVPHLKRRLTMIMQGQKSHSLTWPGCVAVGLLGLLLPLLPVQGQGPPKPQPNTGAQGQDPRDQKIEALKQQIEKLEAEKRSERGSKAAFLQELAERAQVEAQYRLRAAARLKEGTAAADADVQKLEAQAAELKQQIGAKQKEIELLHLRLEETLVAMNQHKAKSEKQRADLNLRSAKEALENRAKEARPADIDVRLERLLKEVEDLKRELQQRKAKPEVPGKLDPPFRKGPSAKESAAADELLEKKKKLLDMYESGALKKELLERKEPLEKRDLLDLLDKKGLLEKKELLEKRDLFDKKEIREKKDPFEKPVEPKKP